MKGGQTLENLRVFIIEPAESMRESLAMFVRNLGHEVIANRDPSVFPCFSTKHCEAPEQAICGDVLIVGQHLPHQAGLDFITQRLDSSCRGLAAHMSVVCAPWSAGDQQRAAKLGCRWFETPLNLGDLQRWLEKIAADLPAGRQLVPRDELLDEFAGRRPA